MDHKCPFNNMLCFSFLTSQPTGALTVARAARHVIAALLHTVLSVTLRLVLVLASLAWMASNVTCVRLDTGIGLQMAVNVSCSCKSFFFSSYEFVDLL